MNYKVYSFFLLNTCTTAAHRSHARLGWLWLAVALAEHSQPQPGQAARQLQAASLSPFLLFGVDSTGLVSE